MTNEYEFEVKFVVPDEVEEENVLMVLREFFGDLIQTDRFIDAVVEADGGMEDFEEERLLDMLTRMDEDDLDAALDAIEELQDGE